MSIDEQHRIFNEAMNLWSYTNQLFMVMEECGELLNVLAKAKRGRGVSREEIITELADVSIMVEQMAFFYGWKDFLIEKERKLQRLKERVEKSKEG